MGVSPEALDGGVMPLGISKGVFSDDAMVKERTGKKWYCMGPASGELSLGRRE